MDTAIVPAIYFTNDDPTVNTLTMNTASGWVNDYTYKAVYDVANSAEVLNNISVAVTNGESILGTTQDSTEMLTVFYVETLNPTVISVTPNLATVADANTGPANFTITVLYSEPMDVFLTPFISFPNENPMGSSLISSLGGSGWTNEQTYVAAYDVLEGQETILDIDIQVSGSIDLAGNTQVQYLAMDAFNIDTENPQVIGVTPSVMTVSDADEGVTGFELAFEYSEDADMTSVPEITFPSEDPTATTLIQNLPQSSWENDTVYVAKFAVLDGDVTLEDIDVAIASGRDAVGNEQVYSPFSDIFSIDTENPAVTNISVNMDTLDWDAAGTATFTIDIDFDESMDEMTAPEISFPVEAPGTIITANSGSSQWNSATNYQAAYDVTAMITEILDIDVRIELCTDEVGNLLIEETFSDLVHINMPDTVSGINSFGQSISINVYPNPVAASNVLQIELPSISEEVKLEITNLHGQVIHSQTIAPNPTQQRLEISTTEITAGFYILNLQGRNISAYQKIEVVK